MTARALPREFLLVAACCRWPLDAEAITAVHAASAAAPDWPYVLRIVKRQRVAGLVHHALTTAAIDMPAPEAETLAAEAQRIVWRNLQLAAESARLQRGFDAAGIAAVVLKGVALGQLAYGSLGLKDSRDIDLLVPAAQAADALRVLEGQGYAPLSPADALNETQRRSYIRYGNEFALRRPGREPMVDLHWRLTDNMRLVAGIDAFAHPQTIAMSAGIGLSTMSDDDLFAYLCVHGASHAWSRLKWLADLNALLARAGESGIERLYRQATGSGFCAGQALLLCQSLLSRRLPAALDAELHGSRRLKLVSAMAIGAMIGPDGATEIEHRPFGSTRVALMRLLLGRGAAFYIAQGRILAVRLSDVMRYPLPRPLHFLYPLLRLPMWLWRRARRLGSDQPQKPAPKPHNKT